MINEHAVKRRDLNMIYKIDHYYNIDHDAQCLIIKSDIEVERLVQILASIQFKFEELIDESVSVDEEHILSLLKEFYEVEDVKEQYKKYIPYTRLENDDWETVNVFRFTHDNFDITQIDLYEARESCCGKKYKEIMKNVLPNDEKLKLLDSTIKELKNFYIERI